MSNNIKSLIVFSDLASGAFCISVTRVRNGLPIQFKRIPQKITHIFPTHLVSKVIYKMLLTKLTVARIRMHNGVFVDIDQELKPEMFTFVRKVVCSSKTGSQVPDPVSVGDRIMLVARECSLEGGRADKFCQPTKCTDSHPGDSSRARLTDSQPGHKTQNTKDINLPLSLCTYDGTININWIQLGKKVKTVVTTYNVPVHY